MMGKLRCVKSGVAAALTVLSLEALAGPITFSFNYLDAADEGFNDPVTGAAARAAINYAGSIWGGYLLASYAGETIHVAASLDSFSVADAGFLAFGSAKTTSWNYASMPFQNTIYGAALANHLVGRDLNTTSDEISVRFNSDKLFYYGLDFNAVSPSYDFVSLALHEMGHGLGFFSKIDHNNSDSSVGSMLGTTSGSSGITNYYPSIYDRFLVDASATNLIDMTDAQRAAALTSSNVFWSGLNGEAANGNVRPEIYAPSSAVSASSLTHFDDSTHFLMDPNLAKGEDIQVDAVTLGVLKDIGWTVTPVPEPGSYAMLLAGLAGLALCRRRVQRS